MLQNTITWFKDIRIEDINSVGGKNASLGEMIYHLSHVGIKVPLGFAISAEAYRFFLSENKLDQKIYSLLESLDTKKYKNYKKLENKFVNGF